MAAKTLSEYLENQKLGEKGIRIAISAWEAATIFMEEKFTSRNSESDAITKLRAIDRCPLYKASKPQPNTQI